MGTRRVELPSGNALQLTELGDGLPVVMCHGFPGLAYSYRHQMQPVANAGFRAVAIDMLGYGGSSAPPDPGAYAHEHVVPDLLAVLDDLGAPRAVFVGHDFGAPVAWNVALRAPERVAGLVLLSVPYDPVRLPVAPSTVYAHVAREHFLHAHYFQQRDVPDAELARDPGGFLARIFHALSGDYRYIDVWKHASEGNGYLDVLPEAPPLPWPWLSQTELDAYADTYRRTGFAGGLNWYRALDANWRLDEPYAGRPLEVPTLFVAGANEPVLDVLGPQALERMRAAVPDLRGEHLLAGAGHWVQQERPDELNALLTSFLATL